MNSSKVFQKSLSIYISPEVYENAPSHYSIASIDYYYV